MVTIKPLGGEAMRFMSATSPESNFTQPPTRLKKAKDILQVERVHHGTGNYFEADTLKAPWYLEINGMPPILGTSDHHELLYHLWQSDSSESNPNDVLLNFDSHDDVEQEKLDPDNDSVTLGDYVGRGFSDRARKVWDHYLFVAPPRAHSESMKKNLPGKSDRYANFELDVAFQDALRIAKEKKSKIVLTLDLDFFGALQMEEFNPEQMEKYKNYLRMIFDFVRENAEYIRLVHITESLSYASKKNEQVAALYKEIAEILQPTKMFSMDWFLQRIREKKRS